MFVTTATSRASSRNERSDSSASTTIQSPSPHAALRPGRPQLAADQVGRVAARLDQRVRGHAGGGRLAVGAGHRDRLLEARDLAQQLPAMDHAPVRRGQLGVVLGNGGRHDHLGAGGHVGGIVADRRLDAVLAQAGRVWRLGPVGAGHVGAQRARDHRQAAHPGAPDADEVQFSLRERGGAHRGWTLRVSLAARARWPYPPESALQGGAGVTEGRHGKLSTRARRMRAAPLAVAVVALVWAAPASADVSTGDQPAAASGLLPPDATPPPSISSDPQQVGQTLTGDDGFSGATSRDRIWLRCDTGWHGLRPDRDHERVHPRGCRRGQGAEVPRARHQHHRRLPRGGRRDRGHRRDLAPELRGVAVVHRNPDRRPGPVGQRRRLDRHAHDRVHLSVAAMQPCLRRASPARPRSTTR